MKKLYILSKFYIRETDLGDLGDFAKYMWFMLIGEVAKTQGLALVSTDGGLVVGKHFCLPALG